MDTFFVVLDYKQDGTLQSKSVKSTSNEREAQVLSQVILGNVDNYLTDNQEPVSLVTVGPKGRIVEFAMLDVPHTTGGWMFMGEFNA